MLEQYPDVLVAKDLKAILPFGYNKIYKLLNTQTIKSVRVGKQYLIPKADFIKYLTSSEH